MAELQIETVESTTSKIEWTRLPAINAPFELTKSRKFCIRDDSAASQPGQPSRGPASGGVRLSSINPENPNVVLGRYADPAATGWTIIGEEVFVMKGGQVLVCDPETLNQKKVIQLGTVVVPANGRPQTVKRVPGPGLRDMRDGTSNTLLVVQVGADKAVPWTRPADAEIDPEKPLACLGKLSGPAFVTVMADGAVRTWQTSISATLSRALATPQGGEVLKSSDLREAQVK